MKENDIRHFVVRPFWTDLIHLSNKKMKNIKIGPHVRELRCARQTQTRFLRRGLKIGTHLSEQEGQYAEVRRHELLAVGGPSFLDVLVRRGGAHAQQAHV